jgi:hypothetical protein
MENKKKYIEFCKKENISIFSQYWWLDSVCGENNWDVLLYEKGGQIVASMPYYLKDNKISMPKLTQTMGIYFKYPKNQKYYKRLSFEKEVINFFINNLPKVDSFLQNFNYSFTNWLPFYWNEFIQTTRYTYLLENIEIDEIEKKFENDIRRRIRKTNDLDISVYESDNIEAFYKVNKMTFDRKNMKIPYSLDFVKTLYDNCNKNNACKIYLAEDCNKNIIACNFLVYDTKTVYYIMGGIDPTKKDLGAMDLILNESIKFTVLNNKRFDFEGSMLESVEKYFRSFGAKQVPYFTISKANSKLLRLKIAIKDLVKTIVR